MPSWKKRFFILSNNGVLQYFTEEEVKTTLTRKGELLGRIPLFGGKVRKDKSKETVFRVTVAAAEAKLGREYTLQARNRRDRVCVGS